MPKFRTHYHNLNVAENATIEEIRAAFKTHFLKYHPDKHPNNREHAERLIQIGREAYLILSDSLKKDVYDAWVAENREIAKLNLHTDVKPGQENQHNFAAAKGEERALNEPVLKTAQPAPVNKARHWELPAFVCALLIFAYLGWTLLYQQDMQSLVSGKSVSRTDQGFEFNFENKCRHPVTLVVRYKGLDDIWHIGGWWDVESDESVYLENENGERLASRDPIWYYYARATNDSNIEWKGSSPFTVNGVRVKMLEMEDTDGDSEWATTCD
jgi:uncharacterized membrane protein